MVVEKREGARGRRRGRCRCRSGQRTCPRRTIRLAYDAVAAIDGKRPALVLRKGRSVVLHVVLRDVVLPARSVRGLQTVSTLSVGNMGVAVSEQSLVAAFWYQLVFHLCVFVPVIWHGKLMQKLACM